MIHIPEGPEYQGVRDAFARRGLDPSNELHVVAMLKITFPASGRPPKWTDAERAWLAIEVLKMKCRCADGKVVVTRDKDLCSRVAATGRFGAVDGPSLQRQLQRFRSPKTNEFLRRRVEEYCAKNPGIVPDVARRIILLCWEAWEDADGSFHLLPGGADPKLIPQLALSPQDIAFIRAEMQR
jgi:hypothetical protein